MDSWPQDHHRHKRTFEEMSPHASLSPSPMFFGHSAPSLPLDIPPNPFERRRTSHPHNEASRSSQVSSQSMAEPRMAPIDDLEHRTSQATIIDLTADSPESEARGINARYVPRRPHLGRSDALSFEDIIDLTDDTVDDDIEIIEARIIRMPPPAPQGPISHRRLPTPRQAIGAENFDRDQPEMFIPQEPNDAERMLRDPRHLIGREIIGQGRLAQIGVMAGRLANMAQAWNRDDRVSVVFQLNQPGQRMPDLDYHNLPFVRNPRSPPKPPHQPPSAANPGFTRSPEETDQVICPACEDELIANKPEDEPLAKKPGGRAQSKKDREEHPFWVVKECGHVYCNKCYQARRVDRKNKRSPFPHSSNGAGKVFPVCAVDECGNDVGDKKHWVGVFI